MGKRTSKQTFTADWRADLCPEWGATPSRPRPQLPPWTVTTYRSAVLSSSRQSDSPEGQRTERREESEPHRAVHTHVLPAVRVVLCGQRWDGGGKYDLKAHTPSSQALWSLETSRAEKDP